MKNNNPQKIYTCISIKFGNHSMKSNNFSSIKITIFALKNYCSAFDVHIS